MSVCAVMLVKDEADIIEYTVRYLWTQVDHLIVADNASSDGTPAILKRLGVDVHHDDDPAYHQSAKTTTLAQMARTSGYDWVVPCDADEVWHAGNGRPLRDYLDAVDPRVDVITGKWCDHVVTPLDDPGVSDPMKRLVWRKRAAHHQLAKVACRTRPDLVIGEGNHDAFIDGKINTRPGLVVRHFPYRDPSQYVRKMRNGAAALAVTDAPEALFSHWRMTATMTDEEIAEQGRRLFLVDDPRRSRSVIYDPAPPHGDPRALRRRMRVAASDGRTQLGLLLERWGLR